MHNSELTRKMLIGTLVDVQLYLSRSINYNRWLATGKGTCLEFDPCSQCDQIGRFLKVLVNKFAYKISPKILVTFGIFRNRSIYVKTALGYNLGNFWKDLGNFLRQHLGHTAANGKNWAKSGNKKGIKMQFDFLRFCGSATVWPEKNRQMSIKVAQKWFC